MTLLFAVNSGVYAPGQLAAMGAPMGLGCGALSASQFWPELSADRAGGAPHQAVDEVAYADQSPQAEASSFVLNPPGGPPRSSPFVNSAVQAARDALLQKAVRTWDVAAGIFDRANSAAQAAMLSARRFAGFESDAADSHAARERRIALATVASAMIAGCSMDHELSSVLLDAVVFKAFGGLGLFLLGMKMMSEGLQTVSADRVKFIIGKLTHNRFAGLAAGTAVTATVQSSSVTTVTTVGLVDARLMSLRQALSVVFGANIGTTITGWLFALKIVKYGLPIIGSGGIPYFFSSNKQAQNVGKSVMGLGLVFYGLTTMSSGFKDPTVSAYLHEIFSNLSGTSYSGILGCIVAGAIATEIVQSSSATLGVTISLAKAGVIPFETAAALVLGLNIGTTVTACLAALRRGTSTDAKRVALAHVLFNVIGASLIFPLSPQYIEAMRNTLDSLGVESVEKKVAFSHTLFNVMASGLFISMLGPYQRLLETLLKSKKGEDGGDGFTRLSDALLANPRLAVEAVERFTTDMVGMTGGMLDELSRVLRGELSVSDNGLMADEEAMDRAEARLFAYTDSVVGRGVVSEAQAGRLSANRRIADQIETVSDELVGILKRLMRINALDIRLPDGLRADLLEVHARMTEYFAHINEAVTGAGRLDEGFVSAERRNIGNLINKMMEQHRRRTLQPDNTDSAESRIGVLYIEMLRHYHSTLRRLKNVADEVGNDS